MINLSYIIPFYQGQDTIQYMLESIYRIDLSLDEFEVIVVDDCSPIPAETVLANSRETWPNLKIVRHQQNKRQGGAKNTGIRQAKGEYIAFADQDDIVISSNVKEALFIGIQAHADMVSCHFQIKSAIDVTTRGVGTQNLEVSGTEFCEKLFDSSVSLAPWSYLYRRDFLINVNHPYTENVLMEDSDWVAWHLIHVKSICVFPKCIYEWRMNEESITHSYHYTHKIDFLKMGCRKIKDSSKYGYLSESFSNVMKSDGYYNIIGVTQTLWRVDNYFITLINH